MRQWTISDNVMYYRKSDQEVSAFIKVLTEWSLYENLKNKGKDQSVIHKSGRDRLREWSRLPTGAVAYESF